jgi:hypothetical protein
VAAPAGDAPRQSIRLTGNSEQKTEPVEPYRNYTLDYGQDADKFGGNFVIHLTPVTVGLGDPFLIRRVDLSDQPMG